MFHIAILDDYRNVAIESVDRSSLADKAKLAVFNDHLFKANGVVERLASFRRDLSLGRMDHGVLTEAKR